MNASHVVVTYNTTETKRRLIGSLFGNETKVTYLADQPTGLREQVLLDADVLMSWNLKKELGESELGLLKKVKLVQLLSAGADAVPYAGLREDIIIAANTGAYAEPMAEHVLALVLALSKNLLREHANLLHGQFNQSKPTRMLRNGVCGIIGYGGIGRATARLMRALGMRIFGLNTTGSPEEFVEFMGTLRDLRAVLSASDVVVLSLPLTKTTQGLIGKRELEWMKPDAVLINVARGAIIDEAALYAHLVSHPDFRAGIDAWWIEPFSQGTFGTDYPFLELPNVIGSPHNSAMAPGAGDEGVKRAAGNVTLFLQGLEVRGRIRRDDYI
jgi:phosphoglycerate dehydrogenase-like enzyme